MAEETVVENTDKDTSSSELSDLKSRFHGVDQENQTLRSDIETQKESQRAMQEQIDQLSRPANQTNDETRNRESINRINENADGYINEIVEKKLAEERKQRGVEEVEAYIVEQPEFKKQGEVYRKRMIKAINELSGDYGAKAVGAAAMLRALESGKDTEVVEKDGSRRVTKESVASLRGGGGGGGGFTRAQIAAMSVEEYQKNSPAIQRAAESGNITE